MRNASPSEETESLSNATESAPDDAHSDAMGSTANDDSTAGPGAAGATGAVDERLEEEERWRETRSIPSIDPAKTRSDESRSRRGRPGTASDRFSSGNASGDPVDGTVFAPVDDESDVSGVGPRRGTKADGSAGAPHEEDSRAELRARLEEAIDTRDRLEAEARAAGEERDEVQAENQRLSSRIDELRATIDRLETSLERERGRSLDAGGTDGRQLSPERALSETNLFVRYETKSDATLETAHDADAGLDAVASNLRLEHHTDFDADAVTVTGHSFEEFLASRMEYQFVDWLTGTALFEIRDTGHADDMADLFDAIPRIDRVEMDATVALADDTEGPPETVDFDVVAFDKMGTPLAVATLEDSREPVGEETLEEIEASASAVKETHPEFGAAIVITSSYFDPGALEVAERATSGGFLSRGSKQSYVTLSRKYGYHLCLVESRSGGFHVTVPEL